jgi:hypothetical protein
VWRGDTRWDGDPEVPPPAGEIQTERAVDEIIGDKLESKGVLLKGGTMLDMTIIQPAPSKKNRGKSRDPEMNQTKKGNQLYFWMQVPVGAYVNSGVVHTVSVTADAPDIGELSSLLREDDRAVFGYVAYMRKRFNRAARAAGGFWVWPWRRHRNAPLARDSDGAIAICLQSAVGSNTFFDLWYVNSDRRKFDSGDWRRTPPRYSHDWADQSVRKSLRISGWGEALRLKSSNSGNSKSFNRGLLIIWPTFPRNYPNRTPER